MDFYIREDGFRVWLPNVEFITKSEDEDEYNSRRIIGVMSTATKDRQGERVLAKGLDFNPFLQYGHFNDNHSQSTSAIVGYPERVFYSKEIATPTGKTEGWLAEGYVLKGTSRSDGIWELAKALASTPDKRLGFSIEGKVIRRSNAIIEKAMIKNVAITNCPVNTECTWDVLTKSFLNIDIARKSLSAGYGAASGPVGQTNGAALSPESLEKDDDKRNKKKKNALKLMMSAYELPDVDDFEKAFEIVQKLRPDFEDGAVAEFVKHFLRRK